MAKPRASKVGKGGLQPLVNEPQNRGERDDAATMAKETGGTARAADNGPATGQRAIKGRKVSGGGRIRGGAPGKPTG